jgi:hypothetical protein
MPLLTGVRASGRAGSVGAPTSGSVALKIPRVYFFAGGSAGASGSVSLTLPKLTMSSKGGGTAAVVGMRLPALGIAATGVVGGYGKVSLVLPSMQLKVGGTASFGLTLPSLHLTTSGRTGVVGSVTLALPRLSLTARASVPVQGVVSLALRAPVISIDATGGRSGRMNLTLARIALAAEGRTGQIGSVTLVLPVVRVGVTGYDHPTGVAHLTLPMLHLVAAGRVSAGPAQTFAIHTETMALTQYSNFPFNSFAQFNGVVIGASDQGLFALGGDTDNGVAIDAFARVGITDFGTSHLKRVDRIYVGYRAKGDLILRIYTNEVQQRDYLLRAMSGPNLHGNHARLGKGLSARYWQFEVRNRDGADFDLNTIELKPTTLRRRVGGWDA